RNQTDERADLELDEPPVRKLERIVEKLVLVIPQAYSLAVAADIGQRLSDIEEMLKELGRDVFIDRIVQSEFQGDPHQVQAIHGHPTRSVRLIQKAARWQRRATVENANVVEAEKASLKNIPPLSVLAVDPPGEIE